MALRKIKGDSIETVHFWKHACICRSEVRIESGGKEDFGHESLNNSSNLKCHVLMKPILIWYHEVIQ